jgi:hypothetical protein
MPSVSNPFDSFQLFFLNIVLVLAGYLVSALLNGTIVVSLELLRSSQPRHKYSCMETHHQRLRRSEEFINFPT